MPTGGGAPSMVRKRYVASNSAGGRGKDRFAVVDRHDSQGGQGLRRVSYHRTFDQARSEAQRLNAAHEAQQEGR